MKKTKLLSILTTVVLTVSLLAGCGSKAGDSTGSKESSGKDVKITFLNYKRRNCNSIRRCSKSFYKRKS